MYKLFLICVFFIFPVFASAQDVSKFPIQVKGKHTAKRVVFYLSGDGGMNNFSQKLSEDLTENNTMVVSLDSRKYFWAQKTPDKMAQDMASIIQHYLKLCDKEEFSLIGYSFGADAALFLATRLSKEIQQKLKSMVLLSPSTSTDFVVRLSDMMGFGSREAKYKTLPELNKINLPVLCVFGQDEENDFYKGMPDKKNISKVLIPGSHKFGNDMKKVIATIIMGLY